jgi:hypothetical protein
MSPCLAKRNEFHWNPSLKNSYIGKRLSKYKVKDTDQTANTQARYGLHFLFLGFMEWRHPYEAL